STPASSFTLTLTPSTSTPRPWDAMRSRWTGRRSRTSSSSAPSDFEDLVRAWFRSVGLGLPYSLFERLSDCPPQHDLKPLIELGACLLRQRIPLPCPCERVRECTDADRKLECAGESATPRLEIRVAQP